MKSRLSLALIACLAVFVCRSPAQSTAISNLSASSGDGLLIHPFIVGANFVAGSFDSQISSLSFSLLNYGSIAGAGTMTLSLWSRPASINSQNVTAPTSLLASQVVSFSLNPSVKQVVSFNSATLGDLASYTLSAGQSYTLALSKASFTNESNATILWSYNSGGAYTLSDGFAAWGMIRDTVDMTAPYIWDNSNYGMNMVFSMDVSSVSAVPEPSTYGALAGLGALGVVALRRRRKQAPPSFRQAA